MKFGLAKEMITPNYLCHMIGFAEYYNKYFESIHDDIYVRSIVMKDGKNTNIIVAFDLLFHDNILTERIQDFVLKEYQIKPESVIVSYTHTHYGPAVKGYFSEMASEEYEEFLFERTKSCIKKCFLNMFDGTISFGTIKADENISRRRMVNGEFIMAPNLDADKDNDVNVFKIEDNDYNVRGILVNYSCHPVTLKVKMKISSEYPGRICNILENFYYGCTAVFLQGAAGDSRPRLTAEGNKFKYGTYDDINEMASSIAERVIKALNTRNYMKEIDLNLKAVRFIIPLKLQVFDKEYFVNDYKTNEYEALRYRAKVIIDNYDNMTDVCELHSGIWLLSKEIMIVFMGGEICYNTKQILINEFKDKAIIFLGYNDAVAYVPSDKIIEEGGYEAEGSVTEYTLKGKFKPDVDDMMINAIRENLNKLEM